MIVSGAVISVISILAVVISFALVIDHYRSENRRLSLDLRRYVEKTSRATEGDARYHLMFQNAPMGCIVWEPGFKVVEVNHQAQSIFGWEREELLGRSFLTALVPIYAREQAIRDASALFVDGVATQMTLPHVTRDGRNITCEWNHSVLRDERGRPVRVVSLCINVTEERGLKLENALFRSIIDLTSDPAVVVLDQREDGAVLYASQAACRQFGKTLDELMGSRPSDWNPSLSLEELKQCWASLEQASTCCFETEHRHSNGWVFPVEVTANRIEHDGKSYVVCYFRDIARRKEDEARLRELEVSAAILEAEKRQLELFENRCAACPHRG